MQKGQTTLKLSVDNRAAYIMRITTIGVEENETKTSQIPIDNDVAKKVRCYHFKYNEDGKPIEIIYQEQGVPATDGFYGVTKIKIDYSGSKEIRTFYNTKDVMVKN